MNIEIGEIIIDKISSLPFLDKYAGVVKTIMYQSAKKDGIGFDKKTFPASCRASLEDCENGKYSDLTPNSFKASVLYLEDKGTRVIKRQAGRTYWKSSYDLVAWLNLPRLGFSDCNYTGIAISGIISKFPTVPFNEDIFNQISINVTGQNPQNQNPFSKYSYDESIMQYLMYPYDYFVLNIEVDYMVTQACLSVLPIDTPITCLTPPPRKGANIVDQDGNILTTLYAGQTYEVEVLRQIIQTLNDPAPATIIQTLT